MVLLTPNEKLVTPLKSDAGSPAPNFTPDDDGDAVSVSTQDVVVVVVVVVVGKLIYPSSGVMSYHSVSVYSFFER